MRTKFRNRPVQTLRGLLVRWQIMGKEEFTAEEVAEIFGLDTSVGSKDRDCLVGALGRMTVDTRQSATTTNEIKCLDKRQGSPLADWKYLIRDLRNDLPRLEFSIQDDPIILSRAEGARLEEGSTHLDKLKILRNRALNLYSDLAELITDLRGGT